MPKMQIEYIPVDCIQPYERNAKKHPPEQVEQIANSIREFGFKQPLVVDAKNVLVIGHGRLMAAKLLDMVEVPCVRADDLTPEQIQALRLADNKLNESEWDMALLDIELADITELDMVDFGFDLGIDGASFFDRDSRNDTSRQEGNDEYNAFLDKFEQPKTTDDCYTPDNVYKAVADWVREKYELGDAPFVRPFFPGGDYQRHKYPAGCVVVDNPPFSIYAEIVDFYIANDIKFFLFAPSVNTFNYNTRDTVCAVCTSNTVMYENGAVVNTSFVTNLGDGTIAAFSAPSLYAAVDAANSENEAARRVNLPKYDFPDSVITASQLGWLGKYGVEFEIKRSDSMFIRSLDAMREADKAIYGGGLLLSEKAAAEKAAAEKWELSPREKEIVRKLGGLNGER